MGGPDNLRGIEYQISYTVYRVVAALISDPRNVIGFEVESLDNGAEDLNIHYEDGRIERIQIKKRDESYQWLPSGLKPVLKRFVENQKPTDDFVFVTNAPGNADLRILKEKIASGMKLDSQMLKKFTAGGLTQRNVSKILRRTAIYTRAFSSDDDTQPGKVLREKAKQILSTPPYWLAGDLDDAFNAIWTYVYDVPFKHAP